jgi:hypothetical protein
MWQLLLFEASKLEPNLQNLVCGEDQGDTTIIIVVTFFALHHDSATPCSLSKESILKYGIDCNSADLSHSKGGTLSTLARE